MSRYRILFQSSQGETLFFSRFQKTADGVWEARFTAMMDAARSWEKAVDAEKFLREGTRKGLFFSIGGWNNLGVSDQEVRHCSTCGKEIADTDEYAAEGYCSTACKITAITNEDEFYGVLSIIHANGEAALSVFFENGGRHGDN